MIRTAIRPPTIGAAVLFTTSNGDTPDIPATATITAVIGEILLAIPAASCIGINITIGLRSTDAATAGANAAKAKNGAFPDPIRIEESAIIAVITKIIG